MIKKLKQKRKQNLLKENLKRLKADTMKKDFITHLTEVSILKIGFWDADGYYFNKEGFDKHGGYYDENFVYVGGKGYNYKTGSYNSGYDDFLEDQGDFEDDEFDDPNFNDNDLDGEN